ncbi:hypothetical protein MRX96_044476 [Rhipicephalus microplus]
MEAIFDDATAGRRPIETETAPFLPGGIEDGWKAAGQPALKYGVLFVTKEPDGRKRVSLYCRRDKAPPKEAAGRFREAASGRHRTDGGPGVRQALRL